MRFVCDSPDKGVTDFANQLKHSLEEKEPTLWFVSGGSNIPLAVQIMTRISAAESSHLTIMLIDERYGEVGFENSNAALLSAAGFQPKHAHFIPVLMGNGWQDTIRYYNESVRLALARHTAIFAQVGIGADGHIAGILPHSPAVKSTSDLAMGYNATDFKRLTVTFSAFHHIDIAYAFVYGEAKRPALEQLRDQKLTLATQPAQILKVIPEAYVYNDQLE